MTTNDDFNQYDRTLRNILSTLNKQQLLATKFNPTKALQVIAGPGTGKTKVLTSRVAYLLLRHNIKPNEIIVTTFTNKAAKEMIERLQSLFKGTDIDLKNLFIGTFHGICLKILSRFGYKIGLQNGWRIIEEREIDNIINEIINNVPDQIRDYANSFKRLINLCRPNKSGDSWTLNYQMIKREISKLKANAMIPEEYNNEQEHDSALAYFYRKYQDKLHELNALDFDDLLMYCFRLLTKERCLPNIKHVFVDEFQDTNNIQMDLMFLMARGDHHISRGITVVGDPDQSIYSFRNALDQNFQEMVNKSPIPCSQIVLIENYRSTQKILNTSEILIQQQLKGRTLRAPLHAQFDCDFPPVYINFPVLFLQGPSLAKELLYLKALPNLFTFDDFAILVRQRRQIKSIETSLIEHRIPYKIIRGRAFWELKEITSMLNLFRCLLSDNDKSAILQSLIYPSRGLGQTTLEKIGIKMDEMSQRKNLNPLMTLRKINSNQIPFNMTTKIRSVISNFLTMIDSCRTNIEAKVTEPMLDKLFDKMYQDSGLEKEYLYEDCTNNKKKLPSDTVKTISANYGNVRHKNIGILKRYFLGITQIESDNVPFDDKLEASTISGVCLDDITLREYIARFFNSISIFNAANEDLQYNEKETQGRVTISTIHGSKGLEWPVVFIPGCVEGIIPSVFSRDDEENGDDENTGNHTSDDKGDMKEGDDPSNSSNGSNNGTKRPKNTEVSLDEERRMFFVAQTRAKVLLYLSSIDENEGNPMLGGPSRFLTPNLLATLVDDQKVFADIKNIKSLYHAMKKPFPGRNISEIFSFKTLLQDYADFISNRREKMVWGGQQISNIQMLRLERNKLGASNALLSAFSTAADQLKIETQLSGTKNQYAFTHKKSKQSVINNIQMSPQRSHAPTSGIKRSSSPRKIFAPPIDDRLSPIKKKQYTGKDGSAQQQNLVDNNIDNISVEKPSICSSKSLFPLKKENSFEYLKPVKIEDITASEILHNPEDLTVDDRPIVANAKLLADAIINKKKNPSKVLIKKEVGEEFQDKTLKAKTKKDKPSKTKKLSIPQFKKKNEKTDIIREASSSQFDIFSQLSKARKKPKIKDNEIIIIDD